MQQTINRDLLQSYFYPPYIHTNLVHQPAQSVCISGCCDASYQGAVRRQWQRPCRVLQRRDGASQQRPKGWSVIIHGVVALLVKAISIPLEASLAMDDDRSTDTDTLSWLMY